MARYFKPGDKVQLKNGGPLMTVLKYIEVKEPLVGTVESDEFLACEWFDKEGPHRDVFNQNALIRVASELQSPDSEVNRDIEGMRQEQEDRKPEDAWTLSVAIEYLHSLGYRSEFLAGPEGLRDSDTGKLYKPEELKIVKVFRFEGNTDLDDMSVLYAIESNDGKKGWLADAYGVYANPYLQAYIDRIELERDIKG